MPTFIGSHTHPILRKVFSYRVDYITGDGTAQWHAKITHGSALVDVLTKMTVEFTTDSNAPTAITALINQHIDDRDYSGKLD